MSKAVPSPGRPRSFDEAEALRRALSAFWRSGYAATTYSDLERETGLHRQSLIYAFGDKDALFRAALRHYASDRVTAVVGELARNDMPPLECIKAAFALWIVDAQREAMPGCLLVNTAGEFGRKDDAVSEILEAATARLVSAFAAAFARAQERGDIPHVQDPQALARLAVAVGDGSLLRSRAAADPEFAKQAFAAFLSLLKS